MQFLNEIALLIAAATPVGVVAGLNLYLAFAGEAGTLLLPFPRRFPALELQPEAAPTAKPLQDAVVAYEEPLREAA